MGNTRVRTCRSALWLLLALTLGAGAPLGAQTGDPWVGSWELNVAQSRWSPGPGVRSEHSVIESSADEIVIVTTGVDVDGREFRREMRGRFDGKEYPVDGAAQRTVRSFRRLGPNAFEYVTKSGGSIINTITTVSADGRNRASVTTGKTASGQAVHDMQLRERR